ncbi:ubiquitin [Enterocytozoon bieneusi H348]|nr:ubiquitin [Enterocytozoon bieneusi H348]|eukprot:XP_001827745.1 ubiquitin [Enterocytozoon bieneusi H348]
MILKLKSLTGKDKIIEIDGSCTIQELKEKIEEYEMIPPEQQRLISGGKVLVEGNKTLTQYKIGSNSVIHFVLALRGGNNFK